MSLVNRRCSPNQSMMLSLGAFLYFLYAGSAGGRKNTLVKGFHLRMLPVTVPSTVLADASCSYHADKHAGMNNKTPESNFTP